jgi:hypothetical protein
MEFENCYQKRKEQSDRKQNTTLEQVPKLFKLFSVCEETGDGDNITGRNVSQYENSAIASQSA